MVGKNRVLIKNKKYREIATPISVDTKHIVIIDS
jgi:hypothetical protein